MVAPRHKRSPLSFKRASAWTLRRNSYNFSAPVVSAKKQLADKKNKYDNLKVRAAHHLTKTPLSMWCKATPFQGAQSMEEGKKLSQHEGQCTYASMTYYAYMFIRCCSDALQSVVTALYCKILVILGLAFPMAEVISDNVPRGYYQLFYVYLFMGSLLFLFCIYIDLLRTRAMQTGNKTKRDKPKRGSRQIGQEDQIDRTTEVNAVPRPRAHYGSFYLRLGAVCKYYTLNFICTYPLWLCLE